MEQLEYLAEIRGVIEIRDIFGHLQNSLEACHFDYFLPRNCLQFHYESLLETVEMPLKKLFLATKQNLHDIFVNLNHSKLVFLLQQGQGLCLLVEYDGEYRGFVCLPYLLEAD